MQKLNLYTQQPAQNSPLTVLLKKEQRSYKALSALIDFIQGEQKPTHTYKSSMDFETYKRDTLNQTAKLKLKPAHNTPENQFNVMYYKRAILTATQENYRNMTILAAIHNLSSTALKKLVTLIKQSCIRISKEVTLAERQQLEDRHIGRAHAITLQD